jgi:hypothetical protein
MNSVSEIIDFVSVWNHYCETFIGFVYFLVYSVQSKVGNTYMRDSLKLNVEHRIGGRNNETKVLSVRSNIFAFIC